MPEKNDRCYLSSDGHSFVGRVYDLGICVGYFDTYEELSKYPDCLYVFNVQGRVGSLVTRVESLNSVGDLFWLSEEFIQGRLPVSKFEWINFSADSFLMRITSLSDCAALLVNEVYETGLPARKCTVQKLFKADIPEEVCQILADLQSAPEELRTERNQRFHHGFERGISSDSQAFRDVSFHEHHGNKITGVDRNGIKIDTSRYMREGLSEMQTEFNKSCNKVQGLLKCIYEMIEPEFEDRFHKKFNDPETGYGYLKLSKRHRI
ncbi:Cthe_2314 family HEPN domain-containing protein [Thalassospira profundimaris]|uniref:Cthe_2314 family HEPN domain-containing protein n=1 Tax=Thalassospira profundimaris TaxID=502049 RepID=UPI000287200A|nr:Cthe_2314 family HEPN domain-containing protein [Thalassospira profundimaris]EKF06836.1 hypothetical protein TH2_16861 [Thalassospira profundimaris WP0211]